jgi:hypothetical protein
VPGKSYGLDLEKGKLDIPHLLRDVEGDFVVQARIQGNFDLGKLTSGKRRAGFLLTHGKELMRCALSAEKGFARSTTFAAMNTLGQKGGARSYNTGADLGKPSYLRVESRIVTYPNGSHYRQQHMFHSADGKTWTPSRSGPQGTRLPMKVKVGIFVESTAEGNFQVTFDEFKLTPLASQR